MLKKIVVGTLVLGLSGVLVIGAINRATDRLERESRRGEERGSKGLSNRDSGRTRSTVWNDRPETAP